MERAKQIVVTGERNQTAYPNSDSKGRPLVWKEVPVLEFERLPLPPNFFSDFEMSPPEWIIFTSPRAVHFWSEALVEAEASFPISTKVACIGELTAEAAEQDGFTPDFLPSETGTETFLTEFLSVLGETRPQILLPAAEKGRPTLGLQLGRAGCRVFSPKLYRTLPRKEAPTGVTQSGVSQSDLILFTSPSSYDAFQRFFTIPDGMRLGAIGTYTAHHMAEAGRQGVRLLPEGRFERVEEILC